MSDLKKKIKEEISPKLKKELSIVNAMAIPSLSKIVINVGVKNALSDKKSIEVVASVLGEIVGQKPKITVAKKSIATFKLREGDRVGLVVTLRGKRMYDFFEKLVNVVLPRIRDFHGIKNNSFDKEGNYTLGFTELSIFPEVNVGKMDAGLIGQGLEISIITTAQDKKGGYALLSAFGMPFQKEA